MANFTQSAGVPEQLYALCEPLLILTSSAYKVESKVIACPMPLCGLSGATTTTSPIVFITSIRVLIPEALMPSSLVTRISGFFVIF